MPHPLEDRLAEIRRSVRQVLVTYGLSWLAAVVLGSVLAVCFTDWLFHLDDPGVRLILGLCILGLSGWALHRFLLIPLRMRLQDLDLALRIEERYPGFQDSLASTIQFLHGRTDPAVGSPAMQRAVIERTMRQVERIEFNDVVETRGVRRVATVAVCVCVMTAVIVGLNQSETAIALQRLVFPFSAPAWPRNTSLRILNAELEPLEFDADDPLRIARGDTLKLFVENTSGRLPSKIQLEYRVADGKPVVEPLRPTTLRDRHGEPRELAAGHLMALKGPIWFRAVGGDDTGAWYEVHVIPPPIVEMLQVVLTPPAYTGRPVERLPEGVGHMQGLIGTQVAIEATVSKPLRSAAVRVREQERYPAKLSPDGRHFSVSFAIKDSGIYSYWFDLQDSQGFENNEASRYEVRGVLDLVPDIYIDLPSSDLQATADAEVPVKTVAKDDLGLKEMRLLHKSGEAAVSSDKEKTAPHVIPLFDGKGRPQQQTVDYVWKLADLKPALGARIVFYTEATDDYDASLGPPEHVGRSISRTITIVSKEDKAQELAQRQAGLLEDLERTFKLQDQARAQVGELQLQLRNTGALRSQDVDALQRVEMGQRQIGAQLTGPAEGIDKRARDLLDELRSNKLQDPEAERRITRMADELKRLGEENLPAIEQDLTQARKLAQAEPEKPSSRAGQSPRTTKPNAKSGKTFKPGTAPNSDSTTKSDSKQRTQTPQQPGEPETKAAPGNKTVPGKEQPGQEKSPGKSTPDVGTTPEKTGKPSELTGKSLKQVAENQSAVLESLSDMLQQLSEWRNERSTAQDLAELVEGQAELNGQTAELGQRTLTKPREELTPQEQTDLARTAERQQKQAERFDQLDARMQSLIDKAKTENPAAGATLEDALAQARQEAVSGQMREAAAQIGGNKMGAAAQTQQQVLEKLREMEDILRERGATDSESLVKKLKAAEKALDEIRNQQAELLRKVREAEKLTDPEERKAELQKLKKEQQQLHDEVAKEARRLQRLQAHKPGKASSRAASKMQQAQENMEQGDAAAAAEDQEESLDALEQAQRELARDRQKAEEQLAREQLEKIADELKAMITREQAVIDETRRLNDLRAGGGNWTRAQLRSLRDLGETQRTLKLETDRLTETLTAAEVFALALKGAARSMQRAADLLGEKDTGEPTQKAERTARQRFVDLIEALKPEKGKKSQGKPPEQDQAGGGGGGGKGPQGEAISILAQLKMLKTLQEELNERTLDLAKVKAAGAPLAPAQQEELEEVARMQGKLADLIRNLTKLATQAEDDESEEEPAGAPDMQDTGAKPAEEAEENETTVPKAEAE